MIESGRAIIRMVDIPLSSVIHSALEVLESQIEEKKITLVNTVAPDLRVLADPDQLRRVLSNVVHNAIKFTQSGGEIQLSAEVADKMVTVSICDNGPGIPPNDRTRVFERFYQVDSPRTGSPRHNGRGTGLGLAIAKHIVEAHGGKIWAEGNIPTGTNIQFSIPLSEERDAPQQPDASPDQPAGSISES
jgi:two-component system phosphate regulon sensor histidine kinase PhoR